MKFTLQCKDPCLILRPLLNRVNVLPFNGLGTRTCRLVGFSWATPDKVELTIEHKPDGYNGKHQAQSFRVIQHAERRKPGRPRTT